MISLFSCVVQEFGNMENSRVIVEPCTLAWQFLSQTLTHRPNFALCILKISKQLPKNCEKSERNTILLFRMNENWWSAHQYAKPEGGFMSVWHTWNAAEILIDYGNYSADRQFDQYARETTGDLLLYFEASFGNDDALWAAIALAKYYTLSGNGTNENVTLKLFQKIKFFDPISLAGSLVMSTVDIRTQLYVCTGQIE